MAGGGPRASGRSDIARLCRAGVTGTGTDGGGVAVLSSGRRSVLVHATDGVARAVQELQLATGEGPRHHAGTSSTPVLVADAADEMDRWPGLVPELAALGVGALFAFPIRVGQVALGTLDLYRREPGPLTDAQVGVGLTVGAALGGSLLAPDAPRRLPEVEESMLVHRAAGMVMVQLGAGIDDALARLRATAYEEGVGVTMVAIEVLDGIRRYVVEEA